jgi:hypothetical protein
LRRAWQTGDDNLMAAAQLVPLKELRRAGFRDEEEIKKMSGAKGALTRGRKLRTQSWDANSIHWCISANHVLLPDLGLVPTKNAIETHTVAVSLPRSVPSSPCL